VADGKSVWERRKGMSEKGKKELEAIREKLEKLPESVAQKAVELYGARMEGFAEGYAAGVAEKS
jgi:hypothetical protein